MATLELYEPGQTGKRIGIKKQGLVQGALKHTNTRLRARARFRDEVRTFDGAGCSKLAPDKEASWVELELLPVRDRVH